MNCETVEQHLASLVFDEIDANLKTQVTEHLEGCEKCRQSLADLRATTDLLRDGLQAAALPSLGSDRRERLMEAASIEEPIPILRFRGVLTGLAVAASIALVCGGLIGVFFRLGGGGGQFAKDERGRNILEGSRLREFRFKVDQALKSEPGSDYAAEAMKDVATQYTPEELRLIKKRLETHWEEVKDDPSVHKGVKQFVQHAVEKVQGKETTWKPPVKPRAAPLPPGFGPNETDSFVSQSALSRSNVPRPQRQTAGSDPTDDGRKQANLHESGLELRELALKGQVEVRPLAPLKFSMPRSRESSQVDDAPSDGWSRRSYETTASVDRDLKKTLRSEGEELEAGVPQFGKMEELKKRFKLPDGTTGIGVSGGVGAAAATTSSKIPEEQAGQSLAEQQDNLKLGVPLSARKPSYNQGGGQEKSPKNEPQASRRRWHRTVRRRADLETEKANGIDGDRRASERPRRLSGAPPDAMGGPEGMLKRPADDWKDVVHRNGGSFGDSVPKGKAQKKNMEVALRNLRSELDAALDARDSQSVHMANEGRGAATRTPKRVANLAERFGETDTTSDGTPDVLAGDPQPDSEREVASKEASGESTIRGGVDRVRKPDSESVPGASKDASELDGEDLQDLLKKQETLPKMLALGRTFLLDGDKPGNKILKETDNQEFENEEPADADETTVPMAEENYRNANDWKDVLPKGEATTGGSSEKADGENRDKTVNTAIRVFNVRDLVDSTRGFSGAPQLGVGGGGGGGAVTGVQQAGRGGGNLGQTEGRGIAPDSLIDIIQEITGTDKWQESGGPGSIQVLNGRLIVTQTLKNHREIVALLETLRENRDELKKIEETVAADLPAVVHPQVAPTPDLEQKTFNLARANPRDVRRSIQNRYKNPQQRTDILIDAKASSLVVKAPPEDMAKIAEFVKNLESGADVETVSLPIEHADVNQVANTLRRLWQGKRGQARFGTAPNSNQLIVTAETDVYESEIKPLIDQIVAVYAQQESFTERFELKHAQSESLWRNLRQALQAEGRTRNLPGPNIVVLHDSQNNAITVSAPEALRDYARELIGEHDQPPAVATPPVVPPINPFVMAEKDRFSTFGIDVDTASYAIARNHIVAQRQLPPAEMVRTEEFVNAFDYNYPPDREKVFRVHAEAAPSPFGAGLTLLKIGVKARVEGRDGRRGAHLVFVVDASGSMDRPDRLGLVQNSLELAVGQLSPADRVSLVAYDTKAHLVAEAQPADSAETLRSAIQSVKCQGSTNMLDGLALGYEVAARTFMPGRINRVILCSDGVANVGPIDAEEILEQVDSYRRQGVTFTSVGFGSGAYNDALLEKLANRGDGSYVFVDNDEQARRVFVDEFAATIHTIAKDAKIQVEFDPRRVRRYRLLGYENRKIADEDFRNDTIDAGEVGSGQAATALYEVELLESRDGLAPVSNDFGTVSVRYRDAESGAIDEIAYRLKSDIVRPLTPATTPRFFVAAAAAEFAEILRGSEYAGESSLDAVGDVLQEACSELPLDTRAAELLELVRRAKGLPRAP
jgi:Ca-activated chloride channel family protein